MADHHRQTGNDPYHQRALQLATQMYFRCDRHEGIPVLWSANVNGFSDPCDALRRLGVMKPFATRPGRKWTPEQRHFEINVLAYAFQVSWEPGQPLPLIRHPGEPSHADLLRALCNEAWFEGLKLRDLNIDLGIGEAETAFIVDLLARRLASWDAKAGAMIDVDKFGWTEISNDYWRSRLERARELGSEEALFPASSEVGTE